MSDLTIPSAVSSNPLVSRLDRLDFIMKYLERRTKFQGLESYNINISSLYGGGSEVERNGFMPMDLALKEVQFKGPLVDRVAALESRLFQLCLDMESSSTSHASSSGTSSSQTSGDTCSLRSSCSLPTFNNPNPNYGNTRISQVHVMTTTHEIEEKSDREERNLLPKSPKQKLEKNKPNKDGKATKSEKKRTRPRWPHFRLLGCN